MLEVLLKLTVKLFEADANSTLLECAGAAYDQHVPNPDEAIRILAEVSSQMRRSGVRFDVPTGQQVAINFGPGVQLDLMLKPAIVTFVSAWLRTDTELEKADNERRSRRDLPAVLRRALTRGGRSTVMFVS